MRWVIRDDGGPLETSGQETARYAGNFLMVPLTLGVGGPLSMNDGGHAVLNAADHCILEPLMPATGSPDRQTCDDRTARLDRLRAPLPAPVESGLPTP